VCCVCVVFISFVGADTYIKLSVKVSNVLITIYYNYYRAVITHIKVLQRFKYYTNTAHTYQYFENL